MQKLKAHGRFIVAFVALTIAFILSVQFGDRGVEFDLRNSAFSATADDPGDYDLAALKILNRVLLQIKDNYVEPDRIDPNAMLVYALDEIQNSIAEVVADFDRPYDDGPTSVTLTVDESSKKFEIGKIESLWEMSFRLKEMFGFVQEHLDPVEAEVEYQDVEYAAINGMLSTLDPHSILLPPRHYEEMQTQTGGKFGGLGIVISIRDGQLTVISPIDGTPAARKGVKARDQIVRIDEESTVNMNLSEAVNMMRGEPGTDCDLYILRKGWDEPRKFSITRAEIKIDSVDSQPLKNRVGYIRIKNFQANTSSDLKKHVGELRDKMGGLQGLVLDMRDNPGGLLDQSIKVSDFFLEEGTIVSTVGVGDRLREKRDAKKSGTEPEYPIVVLVNAGSASASEIVAGALQNHGRAILVGDTTFGKGSVQVLYEFPDNSALKLTVAQYLTPGDVSIQSSGITPDLAVFPAVVRKDELDLYPPSHIPRERDLDAHLKRAGESVQPDDSYLLRYFDEERSRASDDDDDDEFRNPDEFREDFEIRFAQSLLSNTGKTWRREAMLEKVTSEIERVEKKELTSIRKALRGVKIDWADGTSPSTPELDIKLETSAENGRVKAGEKVTISASVSNRGSRPIHQLKALTESANPLLDDREFLFGRINPGATQSWDISVTIPKDFSTRHDWITFKFSDESQDFEALDSELELQIEGTPQPAFAFSYDIIDFSGNGTLSLGEEATLRVFVTNVGAGDAGETVVTLQNLAQEAVYLKRGRENLDTIKVGEEVMVDFTFNVKEVPKDKDIKLEVDVYDKTFRQITMKKFSIPFVEKDTSAKKRDGVVRIKSGPTKLFVGSNALSDVAGLASAGTRLVLKAETDGWYQVDLNGRMAWIQKERVETDASASKADVASVKLERSIMFQPPLLKLEPAARVVKTPTVDLSGTITDDTSVKDYTILVYTRENSKSESRKLSYVKAGGKTARIDRNIPLRKGMNRIIVTARDNDGMSSTEVAFVYRK